MEGSNTKEVEELVSCPHGWPLSRGGIPSTTRWRGEKWNRWLVVPRDVHAPLGDKGVTLQSAKEHHPNDGPSCDWSWPEKGPPDSFESMNNVNLGSLDSLHRVPSR